MEAVKVRLEVEEIGQPWKLYGLGDIHFGAPGCDVDLLDEYIAQIHDDPWARWIGMGDYIDCITHTDRRRFDPSEFKGTDIAVADLAELPKWQADGILTKLKPIRDKCFALIEGNHEWHLPKFGAQDIMAYMACILEQPNLGPQGYVVVDVYYKNYDKKKGPQYSVTIYCHHGYGGGRLKGSDALELQRQVIGAYADIYMFGHRHSSIIVPEYGTRVTKHNPPKVVRSPRMGMMTGTYSRTFAAGKKTYGSKAGYFYAVLGSPHTEIWAGATHDKGKKMINVKMKSTTPTLSSGPV